MSCIFVSKLVVHLCPVQKAEGVVEGGKGRRFVKCNMSCLRVIKKNKKLKKVLESQKPCRYPHLLYHLADVRAL